MNKRFFASMAAVLILVPLGLLPLLGQERRSVAASHYRLDFGNELAGWLYSAEGGGATSDVVVEKLGPDHIARKHIGGVKYNDLTIQCGVDMSKSVYAWMGSTLALQPQRRDGAVHATDFNYKERSVRHFRNALITEIGFPGADAASKDAAYFRLKFSPDVGDLMPGEAILDAPANNRLPRAWIRSDFRLTIPGLDTTRVLRIEPLVFKQNVTENPVGEQRDYQKEPTSVETPNLVITFPESHAKEFYDWHKDFVILGNNGSDHEKEGVLEFLSRQGGVLLRLKLHGLGIFALGDPPAKVCCDCCPPPPPANDAVRTLVAQMYFESADLEVVDAGF